MYSAKRRKNSLEERSHFVSAMVKRLILPDVFLRKTGASRFFIRILCFAIASASVQNTYMNFAIRIFSFRHRYKVKTLSNFDKLGIILKYRFSFFLYFFQKFLLK